VSTGVRAPAADYLCTGGGAANLTINLSGASSATFTSANHNLGNCNNIFDGPANFTVNGSRVCSGIPIGDPGGNTRVVPVSPSGVTSWSCGTVPPGGICNSSNGTVYVPAGQSMTITANYGTPPADPKGFHDSSTCSVINGWTCDPDNYNLPLSVHFYEGPGFTTFVGATTANVTREAAVGAECGGNSAHGFNFTPPASLFDGNQHAIYAYPINIDASGNPTGNNPPLGGTPKTLGPCGYSASGLVYVDKDNNGSFDAAIDSPYSGEASSIVICQGNQPNGCATPYETLTTSTANGTFTTDGTTPLVPGSYTLLLSLPAGYQAVSPRPPIALITVGGAGSGYTCSPAANCDANGNVQNINFGIANSFPWMQVTGGDATGQYISDPTTTTRGGFADPIPENPAYTTPYVLLPGSGGTPGLLAAGSGTIDLGELGGQVSGPAWNWTVGGFSGYSYNLPTSGATKTSYGNLNYIVKQSHLATTSLTNLAGCSNLANCRLPASFPAGTTIFTADGDVTISNPTSYVFPTDSKYVFLINGKLNIKTKILVPNGSFVLFSSSDDINIDPSVGESNLQYACQPSTVAGGISSHCDLEGYYSTDKSFNLESYDSSGTGQNCSTGNSDLKLNAAGSIVVNAVTSNNGSLSYQTRSLCTGNVGSPVFTVAERPDFILSYPTFLMTTRRYWQEVAP